MLTKVASPRVRVNKGLAVRTFITLAFIGLLIGQIDWLVVSSILDKAKVELVFLTVMLIVFAIAISAYKWQILLASQGINMGFVTLFKVYWIGIFFNNFLPSSIGGDGVRILQVGALAQDKTSIAASVIVERLLATLALVLLALIGLVFFQGQVEELHRQVMIFVIVFILVTWLIVKPPLVLGQIISKLVAKHSKIAGTLAALKQSINGYSNKKWVLCKVTLWSIVFQLLIVLINLCLIYCLGLPPVSLWHCILIIPIISAISMIPLSINGFGVREGAYILFFTPFGYGATEAILLSLAFAFSVMLVSLLGGVFYLTASSMERRVDA